jgi:hypothetical protein
VWRIGLAALLALHGLIHLLGFVVPFRLAEIEGFPYGTTVLGGRVDLGEAGVRVVGVLWLLAAAAFVAAAVGVWLLAPWWWGLALGVTGASLVLCVLGLPQARAGIVVNLVLCGLLLVPTVRGLASGS